MKKNHFAINMITKGLANTQSLITKGIITTAYYEVYSKGVKKHGGIGYPYKDPSLTKEYLDEIGADLIKVYVPWNKKVNPQEKIYVELLSNEISVELMKNDIDIKIEVELIQ